ncbi:uncharacterized protein LOC112599537, partial [Melanaphis sacchari]|uniref:uncharacterized protein LOC112599537 n=1 Tax=Melanaphis sacchari TaxID=742174 RepID=UPI000DC146B2
NIKYVLEMNNQDYNLNNEHVNHWFWYQPMQNAHNNMAVPEMENTSKQIPEHLRINSADKLKLLSLLTDWNMGFLFRTCCDELVDIEALKHITPAQCDLLLSNYPLGIKIKFVDRLKQWRDLGTYEFQNHNTLPSFASTFLK